MTSGSRDSERQERWRCDSCSEHYHVSARPTDHCTVCACAAVFPEYMQSEPPAFAATPPAEPPVTASDGAGLDREEWGVRDDHFGNVDPMDDQETAVRVAASDTRRGVPSKVVRRTTTPWVEVDRA